MLPLVTKDLAAVEDVLVAAAIVLRGREAVGVVFALFDINKVIDPHLLLHNLGETFLLLVRAERQDRFPWSTCGR